MEFELEAPYSPSSTGSELNSEVEVYPLDSENDYQVLDPNEDSGSERAWGSNRGTFYDGNKSLKGNDFDSDNLEEEETYFTQKLLFSTMCRDDFLSPWLKEIKSEQLGGVSASVLDVEVKDPILERITHSFVETSSWLSQYGIYLVKQCCNSYPFTPEGNGYVQSKVHLLFCYGLNMLYYLVLKMNQINCSKHPVVQQMTLLHDLLSDATKLDDRLKAAFSHSLVSGGPEANFTSGTIPEVPVPRSQTIDPLDYYHQIRTQRIGLVQSHTCASEECPKLEGKRSITYQIASNKGILPKRKKEQRNPRVKHRNKYRRAVIKRKSQVLPVVHEIYKYDGETSGIRSKLARSVKIK